MKIFNIFYIISEVLILLRLIPNKSLSTGIVI